MGDALTDQDEVLLRQVHPSWIEEDLPTSQAFRPTPKDAGMLSVDRSSMVSAQASFEAFGKRGHVSQMVYGVSIAEFDKESISCRADPIPATKGDIGNPAHAVADFSGLTDNKCKMVSKRLKQKATDRGRLHPPTDAIG